MLSGQVRRRVQGVPKVNALQLIAISAVLLAFVSGMVIVDNALNYCTEHPDETCCRPDVLCTDIPAWNILPLIGLGFAMLMFAFALSTEMQVTRL